MVVERFRLQEGPGRTSMPSRKRNQRRSICAAIVSGFLLALLAKPTPVLGSIFYSNNVIAVTGQTSPNITGVLSDFTAPSINDYGRCAFTASAGFGNTIVSGNASTNLTNIAANTRSFLYSPYIQINNLNQVAAQDTYNDNDYIKKWLPGSFANEIDITNGNGANEIGFNNPSINSLGNMAYWGFNNSKGGILDESYLYFYQANGQPQVQTSLGANTIIYPVMADTGLVIGNPFFSGTGSIVIYNSDGSVLRTLVSQPSWKSVDLRPGISRDGSIVVWEGDLGNGKGPGIWAYDLNSDEFPTGNNAFLVAGAGQRDLGLDAIGSNITFKNFPFSSRVAVCRWDNPNAPKGSDFTFMVSFVATPSEASPYGLFSESSGLWTVRVDVKNGQARIVGAKPVVQVGDADFDANNLFGLKGQSVTGISIQDPLANVTMTNAQGNLRAQQRGEHQVVFLASFAGNQQAIIKSLFLDSDQDGLPDHWEINGVDMPGYTDYNGSNIPPVHIDLPAMGANPYHKDIFVHVDYMAPDPANIGLTWYRPSPYAIYHVINAFRNAPVTNVDGINGINVHIDYGPDALLNIDHPEKPWGTLSKAGEFAYQQYAGNDVTGTNFNWNNIDSFYKPSYFSPSGRTPIFHYMLFAKWCDATFGCGTSLIPGHHSGSTRGDPGPDSLITLGSYASPPTFFLGAQYAGNDLQQAGTLMHELGHELGLRHGGVNNQGPDPITGIDNDYLYYKPNYLSVMNYLFQFGIPLTNGQLEINYSSIALPDLDEANLNESVGIGEQLFNVDPSERHYTFWGGAGSGKGPLPPPPLVRNPDYYKALAWPAEDWNVDGHPESYVNDGFELFDVNYGYPGAMCLQVVQFNIVLKGADDWQALIFDGGGQIGGAAPGTSADNYGTLMAPEATSEELESNLPPALQAAFTNAPIDVVAYGPKEGPTPLTVLFDGSASTDPSGSVVKWNWKFGDGTTDAGPTVAHTYTSNGVYYAALTVYDNNGQINLIPLLHGVTVTNGDGCSFLLDHTNMDFGLAGGSDSINVTASNSCSWSTFNLADWISFTAATNGIGSGTVSYSVATNTGPSRSATFIVAGQAFTVNQSGLVCNYSISPTNQVFDYPGGSGIVSVTVNGGCTWSATTTNDWISITFGATGSGNGMVNFTVAPNPVIMPRTGTITVAGEVFQVTQAALPCTYTLSSSNQAFPTVGGEGSVNVSSPTGCAWTTENTNTWISIISGTNGNENGVVVYAVAPNNTASAQAGNIIIAGQPFAVTEAGLPCLDTINVASNSFGASGGNGVVEVSAPDGCPWATVNTNAWITITAGTNGAGNGVVAYSVMPNTSPLPLAGVLTIAGQTHYVSQAGRPCSYAVDPTNEVFAAAGGLGSVTVTATPGCAWTAGTTNGWITITSGASGSGSGVVSFSVAPNSSAIPLEGDVTVAGVTVAIFEAGVPCSYSLAPTNQIFPVSGGTNSFTVLAPAGCSWTVINTNAWITIMSPTNGAGDGVVNYSVASNSGLPLTGTISVADQTFTVEEAGVVCTYSISPPTNNFGAAGGGGSVTVTAGVGCNWTVVNTNAWITITSATNGAGDGVVNFLVAPDPGIAQSGTILIAGQTFTVNEGGSIACVYTVTPTNESFDAPGGSGSIVVGASANVCPWTAGTTTPWITITAGTNGTGGGVVNFSVAPNDSGLARAGSIFVAGQTVPIVEAGVPCVFQVGPTNQSFTAAGGTNSISVTSPDGCPWTAATTNDWITITTGSNGAGNGTVNYLVAPDATAIPRDGTITVAGQAVGIHEDGVACNYVLNPAANSFTSTGGTGAFAVSAATGCTWTATTTNNWLTINSGTNGTGNGMVTYSAAPNPGTNPVTGAINVAGQTFTVTVAPLSACALDFPASSNAAIVVISVPWGLTGDYTAQDNPAYFADQVTTGNPVVPSGNYFGWCVDVPDPIAGGPAAYDTLMYSSCDPALDQELPANYPASVYVSPAAWLKINYLLNHKNGAYFYDVQVALWNIIGGPIDPSLLTIPYPPVDTNVVNQLVADANANAGAWQPGCGDVLAVVVAIEATPHDQLSIIEVPYPCGPCVGVSVGVACAQPAGACGAFGKLAAGFKGIQDPAFCYQFTITNCGPVALTNISVVDSLLGNITSNLFPGSNAVLVPGDSATAYLSAAWAANATNTVTVHAQSATGGAPVLASDTAVALVDTAAVTCGVTLSSSCGTVSGAGGNQLVLADCGGPCAVNFNVQVCNTGAADLTGVTISSPSLAALGVALPGAFNLPAGACTNFAWSPAMSCPGQAGTYGVTVTGQAEADTNHCAVYNLGGVSVVSVSSECSATITCGPVSPSICGLVALDCDGSTNFGVLPPLANVTITLMDSGSNVLASTVTDSNGAYCFSAPAGGAYFVSVAPPTNYNETYPPGQTNNQEAVSVGSCLGISGVNFGYRDTTPVTITRRPGDLALGCNPAVIPTADVTQVAANDDRGPAVISATTSDATNGCTVTRTINYTATGSCGVTANCQQQIVWTAQTVPPVITSLPPGGSLGCNPVNLPTDASVTAQSTAVAGCGVAGINVSHVDATNGCTVTRTFAVTATDACGNTSAGSLVTYSWKANMDPPVIYCPSNQVVNTTNPSPAVSGQAAVFDGCDSNVVLSFSDSMTPGSCAGSYVIARTWLAVDGCGNSNTCVQTLTYPGKTASVSGLVLLHCDPGNTNLTADVGLSNVVVTLADPATNAIASMITDTNGTYAFTGLASGSYLVVVTPPTNYAQTFPAGATNNLIAVALVECQSLADVDFGYQDQTPVIFTASPADTNLGCNPASIPTGDVTRVAASDDRGPAVISFTSNDTTNGCDRTRTITYTATGACGLIATRQQFITWTQNTTPPQIFCPAGQIAESMHPDPALTGTAIAVSGCDPNPAVTYKDSLAPGECPGSVIITRTWLAVDACGNSNSCQQTLTYYTNTAVISGLVVLDCTTNATNLAGDAGLSNLTVTLTDVDGQPLATTITDTNGAYAFSNLAVAVYDVVVTPPTNYSETYPAFETNNDTWVFLQTCQGMSGVNFGYGDSTPVTITKSPANIALGCNPTNIPGGNVTEVVANDDRGPAVISYTMSDATNGCSAIRTITYTATGSCGATATCKQLVTWTADKTPPVVTCPADITLTNSGSTPIPPPPSLTGFATATDNCDTNPVVTYSDATTAGASAGSYSIARTWEATDACGNSATCTQEITIASAVQPLTLSCTNGAGQVGEPFCSSLRATGGVPPYTFSIKSGQLPPGLMLNPATGAITGKPEQAGSFAFEGKVTDSAGATAISKCLAGCPQEPIVWKFAEPTGPLGDSQAYEVNGLTVTAYGFKLDGLPTALHGVSNGGDQGVGINGTIHSEIMTNDFVQLDLAAVIAGGAGTATMSISSVEPGEGYNIYGSHVPGKLGTLLAANGSLANKPFPVPAYPDYEYLSVSASAGDVLLSTLCVTLPGSCTITIAPPPCKTIVKGCVKWQPDGHESHGHNYGIGGVEMTVTAENGATLAKMKTDANGDYCFTGLEPGSITVTVSPPQNCQLVSPAGCNNRTRMKLEACQCVTDMNFCYKKGQDHR